MKRVEMMGPPGVGKSTLYEAIIASAEWKANNDYQTATDEKKNILIKEFLNGPAQRWFFKKILDKFKRLESIIIEKNTTLSAWGALNENENTFNDIIKVVLNGRGIKNEHPGFSLERQDRIISSLANTALLLKYGQAKLILEDESLLIRGVALALDEGEGEGYLERYFHAVPTPDLVVSVDLPLNDLEERVKSRATRGKVVHLRQLKKTAEYTGIAMDVLRKRGANNNLQKKQRSQAVYISQIGSGRFFQETE